MKKFVTILLAATVLAAPMAQAQSRHDDRHRGVTVERHTTTKKVIVKKHRWDRGQRLSPAERRHFVDRRDYRRYLSLIHIFANALRLAGTAEAVSAQQSVPAGFADEGAQPA